MGRCGFFLASLLYWERRPVMSWWDRKGENEIDIIAADEIDNKVIFYEVKRQAKEINLDTLKYKAILFNVSKSGSLIP